MCLIIEKRFLTAKQKRQILPKHKTFFMFILCDYEICYLANIICRNRGTNLEQKLYEKYVLSRAINFEIIVEMLRKRNKDTTCNL